MKVIVKYQIIDSENLRYGMFQENGDMIENGDMFQENGDKLENGRTPDRKVSLSTIVVPSILRLWLRIDVHRYTDVIKKKFPTVKEVNYELIETEYN